MNQADTCRSCGASIVWVTMESGNVMPLDAEPNVPGANVGIVDGKGKLIKPGELFEPVYSGDKYLSHFVTCPEREKWRKKEK